MAFCRTRCAEAGYDVLGIDISEAMIAMARRRVPRARFQVESLLTVEIPRSVAVAAVGECINYLFDSGNTRRRLAKLFAEFTKHWYRAESFSLTSPSRGVCSIMGLRTYIEGEDWAVLVNNEEDQQQRLLTRRITSFRQVGALPARSRGPPAAPAAAVRAGSPASWYWLSSAYPSRLWHVTVWDGARRLVGSQAVADRGYAIERTAEAKSGLNFGGARPE